MKKSIFMMTAVLLVLALAACGSSTAATPAGITLSTEGQLLVGTFKLENTDLAVTASQAETLLPLWETLESLASSGTAASQEIQAVVEQIQGTLTSAQLEQIAALKLTQADLAALSSSAGSTASAATASGSTNAAAQFQSGSAPAGGGPGGGTPPSDLGSGGPSTSTGSAVDQVQAASAQASTNASNGTTSQISSQLIATLVELLKTRAG